MSNIDKIKEVLLFCEELAPGFIYFKIPWCKLVCYSSGEINLIKGGRVIFKFTGNWDERIDKIEPYIDMLYKVHNEQFYMMI